MKEVTIFYTNEVTCNCPYCGKILEGWIDNPEGTVDECDHCEKEFKVSTDITIRFQN